jgi:signal transduction histidine kinase
MSKFKLDQDLLDHLRAKGVCKDSIESIENLCIENSRLKNKVELDKFKMMADWSPCTISWIKDDLTYAGVNKTLSDLYEIDSSEFIGKKIGFNSNYAYFLEFSKELFSSQKEHLSTEISAVIDGVDKKFYLVGTKFKEAKEAIIIGLDVTELSSLKESVALMERLSSLGEMVAGIVHEVNNPLTVIQNKAKVIKRHIESGELEKAIDGTQRIFDTCIRMGKIIEGVKSFVRQADNDPHTEVNIHEVLGEAQGLLHSKFLASGVQVKLPTGEIPMIHGNQTQLYQVFINLMTNAIDAIDGCEEKWIEIETESLTDSKIAILFRDSGAGISEEIKSKIFQSFYTTKGSGKGTGLGLSLCQKIVERHGGSIEIVDDSNTCFRITLAA